MPGTRRTVRLSPLADYLFAAAGAWLLWLFANGVVAAAVDFGATPEAFGADTATIEATRMLFSIPGLLLVIVVQFLVTPMIVLLLRRYGLARIAIYMIMYALVWLAILVGPLAAMFGMVGILRQMGWLTLFMLWGAWNWWALVQRPLSRLRHEAGERRSQALRAGHSGA
jgi:hypothetical protein